MWFIGVDLLCTVYLQTTVSVDDNKVIQKQKGDPESTIVREFKGDDMIMVSVAASPSESSA